MDFKGSLAQEDIRTLNTTEAPTAGEWTSNITSDDTLDLLVSPIGQQFVVSHEDAIKLANVINAALAMERKRVEAYQEELDMAAKELAAAKAYADDANIQLAANREQLADQKRDLWEKISLSRIEADNWKGLYEKVNEQLAARQHDITECVATLDAEREKTQQEYNLARLEAAEGLRPHPDVDLRKQLAAERENTEYQHKGWERADKALTILKNEYEKKDKQLAAAVELVNLLKNEYWAQTPLDVAKLADAFLAKISK